MMVIRADALALLAFAINWISCGYSLAAGQTVGAVMSAFTAAIILIFCMTPEKAP